MRLKKIIHSRGYEDTLEYIGEYRDINEYIYDQKDKVVDRIESDLKENDLEYIMEYVNLDHEWLPDTIWGKNNNRLLLIGNYLYKILEGTTQESPYSILKELGRR